MKHQLNIFLTFTFLIYLNTEAQNIVECKNDPNVLAAKKRLQSNTNYDNRWESDAHCSRYFELACKAKLGYYKENGKTFPRTQQQAHNLEAFAEQTIKQYNKLGLNTCGELLPIKAIYKDSIGIRNEMVVGFWLTKEIYYDKVYYTEFYFANDGHMNNSSLDSHKEKSSWKKIDDTTYEITQIWYDDYLQDFSKPQKSKFIIDPKTNTAEHHIILKGKEFIGKFYFKGNFYHNYDKTEEQILTPKSIYKNLKKK